MFGPCNILLKLAKNSRVMAKNHIPKYEHAHQFWFINWSNINIFEEIKFYLIFLIISSRAWTLCQKNHEKSNQSVLNILAKNIERMWKKMHFWLHELCENHENTASRIKQLINWATKVLCFRKRSPKSMCIYINN